MSSVGHLGWLEEEIEVKQFLNTHIALMAYDIEGHKFTNCSSLHHSMSYDQNKLGFVETQSIDWHEIKAYLNSNIDIVKLRHQFDLNPNAYLKSELRNSAPLNESFEFHNNFGVC